MSDPVVTDEAAREAFEAWAKSQGISLQQSLTHNRYKYENTQYAWVSWLAASRSIPAAAALLRSHGYKVLGMGCPDRSGAIAKTYGRLRVLERVENSPRGSAQYLCQCECGNQKVVSGVDLRFGSTKSCGCLKNGFGWRKPPTPPLRTVGSAEPTAEPIAEPMHNVRVSEKE